MEIYRNIFKVAWKLSWRYKYLWFFGIFATLLGNSGEYELLMRTISGNIEINVFSSLKGYAESGIFSFQTVKALGASFVQDPFTMFTMLFVLVITLALMVFIVWLSNVSQIAIVRHSANLFGNKDIKNENIQTGVAVGTKYFWPVFGLNIIGKLFIIIILYIINLPIILSVNSANMAFPNLVFGILFLIMIPVAMSLSLIVKYAIAFVVVKKKKIFESFSLSVKLFCQNWLVSLEVAFMLILVMMVALLLSAFVFVNLKMFFQYITVFTMQYMPAISFWVYLIIAPLLMITVITWIWSVVSVFINSCWTGLFVKLISGGGESKLKRIFEKK